MLYSIGVWRNYKFAKSGQRSSVRGAKKLGRKLSSAKADADLFVPLATTIKTNVELDITPDQLVLGQNNQDQLIEYFCRYEFKRWLNEVISRKLTYQATQQEIKLDKTQTNMGSL